MAGVVALINNFLLQSHQITTPGLGNINPQLYLLAKNYESTIFHDITSGDNIVPCTAGSTDCTTGSYGYSAGVGYDQVSGLGSLDVAELAYDWNNVNITATTLALSSSLPTAGNGDAITFTARVTPGSGTTTPAGSVEFYIDSLLAGTGTLDGSGVATYQATLSSGVHSVSAYYSGSLEFSDSTTHNLQETVLTPTTTTITAGSTTTWTQGVNLGFSIGIDPASATTPVSGVVDVYANGTHLGSVNISTGSGVFNTTALPVGVDQITATFEGNSLFATSTSSAISLTVNAAKRINTSLVLTSSSSAVAAGATVSLVAAVSPASGTTSPTGTVSFYDGGALVGTASLSNGAASFTTAALSAGMHQLNASYAGSTGFTGSSSQQVVVTAAAVTPMRRPFCRPPRQKLLKVLQ